MIDADCGGHIDKTTVPLVAKQLARVGTLAGLIADEQIQPAVVVVVGKGRCMGRVQREQSGTPRHIRKSAVAVVAQQGVGHTALFPHPSPAQNEQIDIAVVVVVGLFEVDPSYLTV